MTYEDNYLAHYGITGQKWGVRRFQNEDGTLTAAGKERYGLSNPENGKQGNLAFSKKYHRESKKLKKWEARTDRDAQAHLALEYDKKAKRASRVAKAATAVALPAAGVSAFANNHKAITDELYNTSWEAHNNKDAMKFLKSHAEKENFGRQTAKAINDAMNFESWRSRTAARALIELPDSKQAAKIAPIATAVAVGAGLTALGAGGVAAYNRIKSLQARKYSTIKGNTKAVEKYEAQYQKMVNMFADTPYADLIKKSA